ncbi:MAG: hypothetical protein ACR2RV_15120 [Verrucomicrobiales bacterium]
MLEEIAPDFFLQRHPLRMAGCQMGRIVSVIRLGSGKLVIHSTAKFSESHVKEIEGLGEPGWLVEATYFHDTCARVGREAFPDIPYLVPPGFEGAGGLATSVLCPAPAEWGEELQVIEIGGMPKVREHAFYHRPSKTLILADLMFNLPPEVGRWTQIFLRATAGIRNYPDMSRLFRLMIKDRGEFISSMQRIIDLDFDKIVVAHGDPIIDDAKSRLLEVLVKHKLAPSEASSSA